MAESTHRTARLAGFLAGPLLFAVLLLTVSDDWISPGANKVLALGAWMICWWVLEVVPSPVTALLPLVGFPFLGVMKMPAAAAPYANPIIFLFMGGFMIALALEKHRLHERIALNLIRFTGTSGNGIIFGFMLATGLISMWISNTATAMMMLPIAVSVIKLIKSDPLADMSRQERNFALSLMLMVGYAATLGGLATIIGTPPNVVFAGLLDQFYHQKLDFGKWMLVGVPIMILTLLATYFILTRLLYPNHIRKIEGSDEMISRRLSELGRLRAEEKWVLAIFCATSLFWIFQQPLNLAMGRDLLNDTNIGMTGGLLMFVVPADWRKGVMILDWNDTTKLAWGILLLFGGGLCLAQAMENTGIIQEIGKWIAAQSSFNGWLILLLIVVGVILSELMSNVALVQIFVPVVFGIASGLGVNPILLAMPVTLSASIGFMFPIATPPNAIVFASGHIKMTEMLRAGVLLDLVCIVIIWLASLTLVPWVYGGS
jgi:sodium-dependent dicarboxylate transporter 2/3/5